MGHPRKTEDGFKEKETSAENKKRRKEILSLDKP